MTGIVGEKYPEDDLQGKEADHTDHGKLHDQMGDLCEAHRTYVPAQSPFW